MRSPTRAKAAKTANAKVFIAGPSETPTTMAGPGFPAQIPQAVHSLTGTFPAA